VVKTSFLDKLGADLQTLSKKDATQLNVKGGVLVRSIDERGLLSRTKMEEGFVILKVNGQDVMSVEEFRKALESAGSGSVKLEGVYSNYDGTFTYPLKLNADE
jgi:S1-C subfamily serine protease